MLRDVTERVETARALDKANDDLRLLVHASLEFGASLKTADVLGVARRAACASCQAPTSAISTA